MNGRFETAAIAIFVAMVFDGLDGRVARLTNTQSKFGAEYDSLSDMVSFGVAPGLVMFSWALGGLGKFGWAVAFIYVACAALRLARFNTQIDTADKNFFSGLASPAAAAVMAGIVWVCQDQGWVGENVPTVLGHHRGLYDCADGVSDDLQRQISQLQGARFARPRSFRGDDSDRCRYRGCHAGAFRYAADRFPDLRRFGPRHDWAAKLRQPSV